VLGVPSLLGAEGGRFEDRTVAVDAAVAMRGRSDNAVTTTLAAQETGQQVAAGIGGLGTGGIRAFCEQELCPLEQLAVDDGLMGGLVVHVAMHHLVYLCNRAGERRRRGLDREATSGYV
jgi:hypothetical protein